MAHRNRRKERSFGYRISRLYGEIARCQQAKLDGKLESGEAQSCPLRQEASDRRSQTQS